MNMRRLLLQVNTIERLSLPALNGEIALLPFSAKVDHLDYKISFAALLDADMPTLNIVANKLALTICFGTFPTELLMSFLRRVAELGHFVELEFGFDNFRYKDDIPACVAEGLGRSIVENRNLMVLDLCAYADYLNWGPHLGILFTCLEEHKSLRTFKVTVSDSAFGPDYSYLKQLLSRNRRITVTNDEGNIYSDGTLIDELYSLNRFYMGSADLAVQSPSERSSLVATALVERAANDFQRTTLLFADHGDALCELVQFARLDELADKDIPPSRAIRSNNRKRRRSAH